MRLKLFKDIKLPEKKRESDAGWDIYLPQDTEFKAHETAVVDLGFGVRLPKGYAGLLAMRSSVCKTGLSIQMPLIDEGYLGELHLLVHNPTDESIRYQKNDRVCSLFVFPVFNDTLEVVDDLGESDRGESWSGSSGK